MVILISILLLVYYNSVQALTLPIYTGSGTLAGPNDLFTPKRTLVTITWSCLLTTLICAWTSVHPNVPPQKQSQALLRRLQLMFWTIISPELVLAWAVRQWFAAREVRDCYNNVNGKWESKQWSMLHGHFLNMGGFMLVSTDVHLLKEPKIPQQEASGIMYAAYLSCRKDYQKKYERCQLGVLTFERLQELLRDPDFEFPIVTAAEIRDRSKGDALSKIIAILQTTWFILQCIARGQQRLALTELELVTLALASLNAVTYVFWWHKPLGVQDPIRIYLPSKSSVSAEEGTENRNEVQPNASTASESLGVLYRLIMSQSTDMFSEIVGWAVKFIQRPCKSGPIKALFKVFIGVPFILCGAVGYALMFLVPLFGIAVLLKLIGTQPVTSEPLGGRGFIAARIVTALRKIRYHITSSIDKSLARFVKWLDYTGQSFIFYAMSIIPALFCILLVIITALLPFFTLLSLVSFIFVAVFGIITSCSVVPGSLHVPIFYSPTTMSDRYSRMVVFALFGVFFGGLHCIGWTFTYPTMAEQKLWRATSLAITVIPIIVAPIDYVLENYSFSDRGFGRGLRLGLDFVVTLLLFVYVPVRLSLIAQAFILLRSQPESAFVGVSWTMYIPHI